MHSKLRRWHVAALGGGRGFEPDQLPGAGAGADRRSANLRDCHLADFARPSSRSPSRKPLRPGPPIWSRSAGACGCSWSARRRSMPASTPWCRFCCPSRARRAWSPTVNAAILAGVVIAIAVSLMRVKGETDFRARRKACRARPSLSSETSASDRRLLDALMRLMADERIYRHEGITIGTLATKLAVPEYRLRRLINQQLGYRNFNVFLNNHRIEEAKAALADPIAGRSARHHHRDGCRLPVARAVQPRLQGDHRASRRPNTAGSMRPAA